MKIRVDASSYKWLLVAVLFLAASLNYADRGALMAVFPLLKKDLGMSDLALAAIGSFFLWSYALFSPLAGFLGDRFSRSSLVTWSVAAWSLVTALTGLVPSGEWLLGMRVLLGVAESLYIPASLALIADYHSAHSRATAMAIHLSGFYAGVVFGGTLAGYLGDRYGWRPSLFVLGGVGLLLAMLCRFVLRDQPASATADAPAAPSGEAVPFGKTLLRLVGTPSCLILLTEAMLLAIATWIFANWLPLYFTETFKLNLSGAGFSGTFPLQAGSIMGVLLGGYFSDRIARRLLQRRMLLHSLCYLAGAPLLLVFFGSPSHGVIVAAIFGFSLLRAVGGANANPLLCDLLPAKCRSTAIGLMNSINCFAGGAGIFVAGYLKLDFGLAGVFAGTSAMVMMAGLLLLGGYRFYLSRDLDRQCQHHEGTSAPGLLQAP